MPKKKYVKRPFPKKGVDWDKIKKDKSNARTKPQALSDVRKVG